MLSNKSLNLGIRLKREGELAFAVVQVPSILPRLVELPCENGRAFVLLETIIEAHLAELFELLSGAGAKITFLEEEGHLPVRIAGCRSARADETAGETPRRLSLDITKSTQFLSALR